MTETTVEKKDELKEFLKKEIEQITIIVDCDDCSGTGDVEYSTGGGNTKQESCNTCLGKGKIEKEFYNVKIKDFGKWIKAKIPGNRDVYVSEMPEIN